jgi:mannose/fructose-specific phosphotransferase system component IIA
MRVFEPPNNAQSRVVHAKQTIRRCAAGLDRDMLLELLSADDLTVFSEMQVCHRTLPAARSTILSGH